MSFQKSAIRAGAAAELVTVTTGAIAWPPSIVLTAAAMTMLPSPAESG